MGAHASLLALLFLLPAGGADEDPAVLFRRFLNVRSASSPSLSPDGKQCVFLTNITGVSQVWRVDRAEGWPHQLTFAEDRVQGVAYSPTGDLLVFGRDEGGNENTQVFTVKPDGTGLRNLTNDPESRHFIGEFSSDGKWLSYASNKRDKATFDVLVMDLDSGESRMLHEGVGFNVPGPFSPDGKKMLFGTWRSNFDSDISVADLESGEVTKLNPDGQVARFEGAAWAKDGRSLIVVTDLGSDFLGLTRVSLEEKEFEFVEEPKWDVSGISMSPDHETLAVVDNEDGYSRLRFLRAETMEPIPAPDLPGGLIGGLSWARGAPYLALDLNTPTSTGDIYRVSLDGKEVTRLTRSSLAGIDPATFTAPELVKYPTFDDLQIPAFLYLPPGAKKDGTLPAVIIAHGGPEGQERPSFSTLRQFFLRQGYAILAPNVRGSTGYGKAYSHLDDVRRRMDSVKDLAAGFDWLVEEKIAHPKKIAVLGGSYGGFMVLAGLTNYPDKYAAGIDIVGISNFVTFLERTKAYRRKLREAEYGSLEEDREFLESVSPIHQVDKIQAPLLVIQGANDPRVPQHEADQIVEALKGRGLPVDYILFEDEGHGIAKLPNRVVAYTRIVEFLDAHIGKVAP